MGLLDRFRPARGEEPQIGATEPDLAESVPDGESSGRDVIRPETLWPAAPEWTKVPVMQPSLPEMPVVVSTHFEDSLIARQPPQRFLGDLGHSVSELAPSGMVEGVAILVRATAAEPADPAAAPAPISSEQPLTLAAPSPSTERADSRRWETSRRLPGFDRPAGTRPGSASVPEDYEAPVPEAPPVPTVGPETGAESTAAYPSAAPQTEPAQTEPAPTEPAQTEPAPTEPMAHLVGAAPIAPAPESIVSVPAVPAISRLVTADRPPEMPLAQLPTTRLPVEERTRRLVSPEPEPGGPAAGLVGEGRGIEPTVPASAASAAVAPAVPSAPPAVVAPGQPTADMPLAPSGAPERRTDDAPPAVEDTHPAVDPAAPTIGAADPISVLPPPVEAVGPIEDTGRADPPDLPLATPPLTPGAGPAKDIPEAETPTAPILGQRPVIESSGAPLVAPAEPEPAPASPPADHPLATGPAAPPRRSGLGEPLASLPSTAAPLSIANMNRAQQAELSRSMIQSQLAAARARANEGIGQQLHQGSPPAATRAPAPDTELPLARAPHAVVPIEPLENTSSGLVYEDIPPAASYMAPLLSMDPLVGQEVIAGPSASPDAPEGASIRASIGQRHGVDLANVPVDRSVRGAAEAHRLGARAFTSDRAVVIPPQAGTLDAGPGQALFAHELTHVAQRIRTGNNMPVESSPAGQRMEAEAAQTELTLNRGGSVPPLMEAPTGFPGRPTSSPSFGFPAGPTAALPLAASAPAPGPDYDALANSIISRMTTLTSPNYPSTEVFQAPASMSFAAPEPALAAPAAAGVQRAAIDDPTLSPPSSSPVPTSASTGERPSDADLSNLSKWLYPLIKFRLKNDLREDRERSGSLTDNYRRW